MDQSYLLFGCNSRLLALPASMVIETLRLPEIDPIPDTPEYVRGVSLLRGEAVPIVDLGHLLQGAKSSESRRIITVRTTAGRRIGLLVSEVFHLISQDQVNLQDLPPLLHGADETVIENLGRLDDAFLSVLKLGHVIPESLWQQLSSREESQ
ncbi:MAG: chemotaxis protein CheW [bacterium]